MIFLKFWKFPDNLPRPEEAIFRTLISARIPRFRNRFSLRYFDISGSRDLGAPGFRGFEPPGAVPLCLGISHTRECVFRDFGILRPLDIGAPVPLGIGISGFRRCGFSRFRVFCISIFRDIGGSVGRYLDSLIFQDSEISRPVSPESRGPAPRGLESC